MPKRQINHCKSYKNVVRFIKHSPCYPHNLTYPIHLALNEKKKPFPNITSNKYFQIFRQNDTLSLIYQTYTCNSNIQQFFTPCENWENCNVKKAVKEQRKNWIQQIYGWQFIDITPTRIVYIEIEIEFLLFYVWVEFQIMAAPICLYFSESMRKYLLTKYAKRTIIARGNYGITRRTMDRYFWKMIICVN